MLPQVGVMLPQVGVMLPHVGVMLPHVDMYSVERDSIYSFNRSIRWSES